MTPMEYQHVCTNNIVVCMTPPTPLRTPQQRDTNTNHALHILSYRNLHQQTANIIHFARAIVGWLCSQRERTNGETVFMLPHRQTLFNRLLFMATNLNKYRFYSA
jgi:hypothetical protein